MKKASTWNVGVGLLLITIVVVLAACGNDQPLPQAVAATNTPLPPAPTEAPTSTPLPPAPTETPTSTPPPPAPVEAPTGTPVPAPTDTPPPAAAASAAQPPAALAEAASQIYAENGCGGCHGVDHQGGFGTIIVGVPEEHLWTATRNGKPEAGMPAFDQNAIGDDDLRTLIDFLSNLTLRDIGVELPPAVIDHLSQARDALQAADKVTLETHLNEARAAGAEASPGVQATLKHLVEGLGEADWKEVTRAHLEVLLAN